MIQFTREAIVVAGFAIRWYGILIACGTMAGIYMMDAREARYGLQKDTALGVCLWVVPVALLCARAYYVAFRWDVYRNDLAGILRFREGGMAIYGGVIGGVITGFIYSRRKRVPFFALADLAAPALALGQAVGRWGNFINQEAYGVKIDNPALQFFPISVYIHAQKGYYAATFFYESAWCFLICGLILFLEKKRAFRFSGAAASLYICMYAAERTVVEALRTDSLYLGGVRVSQALSALALCAVAGLLIRRVKSARAKTRLSLIALVLGAALLTCALFPGIFGMAVLAPAALALLLVCLVGYRA